MKKKNHKSENWDSENLIKIFYAELANIKNFDEIILLERKYLRGKESYLSFLLSGIGKNSNEEERKEKGKKINIWKKEISNLIEDKKQKINLLEKNKKKFEDFETKPSNFISLKNSIGSFHLIKKSLSDIYSFFISRGYSVFEESEVDTKWYNFDSLNLKQDHPARSRSDTFYFSEKEDILLRTHTSNSQTKVMEFNKNKEIMIVSGGKVYRNDDDDLTHSHQYTNIEVIRIDKEVSFANLKWMLEDFFRWFFEKDLKARFRPSFFPFTEPSFEVDVSCSSCFVYEGEKSRECKVCKGTRWIEILGAGLINPKVLKNGGYNEKIFSGFAAGIGLERILMVKYGIDDIRDFYSNDPRFLIQNFWN